MLEKLEIWYLSTHIHVVSENMPFKRLLLMKIKILHTMRNSP